MYIDSSYIYSFYRLNILVGFILVSTFQKAFEMT